MLLRCITLPYESVGGRLKNKIQAINFQSMILIGFSFILSYFSISPSAVLRLWK